MARLLGARLRAVVLGPRATAVLSVVNTLPFALFVLFIWLHERALAGYFLPVVILHQASSLIIASRWYSAVFFDCSLPITWLFKRFPLSTIVSFLPLCAILSFLLLQLIAFLLVLAAHAGVCAWHLAVP